VRVLRGRCVVFALIEECSGVLSLKAVKLTSERVDRDFGGTLSPTAGGIFEPAIAPVRDAGVHAFHTFRSAEIFDQRSSNARRMVRIHRLGEDLKREYVVVAVDDEAGQKIRFTKTMR